MGKHKGSPYRGRSVDMALKASAEAAEAVEGLEGALQHLDSRQKSLFEGLLSGYDELESAVAAGYQEWFCGLKPEMEGINGEMVPTKSLTLSSVRDLTPESYGYLLYLCKKKVAWVTANDDYRKYMEPVREYIKKAAVRAAAHVVRTMDDDSVKAETRLKAAQDILDRAGERPAPAEKDPVIPVQVNILLTGSDGKVVKYEDGDR